MLRVFVSGCIFLKQHRAVRDFSIKTLFLTSQTGALPRAPEPQRQQESALDHRCSRPVLPHAETHPPPLVSTSLRQPRPARAGRAEAANPPPRRPGLAGTAPDTLRTSPGSQSPRGPSRASTSSPGRCTYPPKRELYLPMMATCEGSMPAGAGPDDAG